MNSNALMIKQNEGVLKAFTLLSKRHPDRPIRASMIFDEECGCQTIKQVHHALQRLAHAGLIVHTRTMIGATGRTVSLTGWVVP